MSEQRRRGLLLMSKKQPRQKIVHVLDSEIHSVKAELGKVDQEIKQHIKPKPMLNAVIVSAVLFLLLALGALFFQGGMTGWLVGGDQYISHSQELGWNITESTEETVLLEQHTVLFNLKSLKLNGQFKGEGNFTVYLEDSLGNRYLVLDDESISEEGLQSITGYVVAEGGKDKKNKSEEKDKETPEERTITTVLEYNAGTLWDSNDDGIESVEDGVVDLTVAQSSFSWAVDESKLCTKWVVSSVESGVDTTVCNGAADCCALSGVAPEESEWDVPLYIFHSKYGATEENTVTAQVVFLNQSIEGDVYFESTVGTSETLPVRFEDTQTDIQTKTFSDVCVDTCLLPDGLNSTEYTLVFELDYGVELYIESMTYSLENLTSDITIPSNVSNVTNATVDITPAVKDSQGKVVPAVIEFYDETGELKSTKEIKDRAEDLDEQDKVSITKGRYKVKIRFTDKTTPVESIELNDVDVSENTTEFINVDDVAEFDEFVEVYAIDPTAINFTNATVTMTAKGNSLYKCKEWDFASQSCYGEWILFKSDLVPGQEYSFILTPDDPGFAEMVIQNCRGDNSADARHTWGSSCAYSYPSTALFYDDDTTENFTITKNKYSGIQINSSNTSVTNCDTITSVLVCHKWWYSSSKSISACDFEVDADGGASPTLYNSNCPDASEPAGITCENVTATETWTCGSFFTASPAGAVAQSDFKGTATGTFFTDVLYFNVTYTETDTAPASISGLANQSAGTTWLYWNWTNPSDTDFNASIVYINGTNVANVSKPDNYYNYTSASCGTSYNITVHTKDHAGNVNTTDVTNISTTAECDTTAPATITNLVNQSAGETWLYWNWTNPGDTDFNSSIVYINGSNVVNVSSPDNYYNYTSASCGTDYNITVHTKDHTGNVNTTDVTNISSTLACPAVTLNITSIEITPDDDGVTPGAQINPLELSNVTVTMIANITNASQIDVCSVRIWNSSTSYASPVFQETGTIQFVGSQTQCNATWNMDYWRNIGDWNVSVDVNLTDSTADQENSSYYYNTLTSHLVNVTYINFSGVAGQTTNSINAYPLAIKNTGNKLINISIKGTHFIGTPDNTVNISIGNATYNETSGGTYTPITLNYVQIVPLDMLAPTETTLLYFRGTIPSGTKAQAYENTISIQSN
jgi:hypothetical protein